MGKSCRTNTSAFLSRLSAGLFAHLTHAMRLVGLATAVRGSAKPACLASPLIQCILVVTDRTRGATSLPTGVRAEGPSRARAGPICLLDQSRTAAAHTASTAVGACSRHTLNGALSAPQLVGCVSVAVLQARLADHPTPCTQAVPAGHTGAAAVRLQDKAGSVFANAVRRGRSAGRKRGGL